MIETYDALCLREPYLELILFGIKTLETRTRALFKNRREVVLTSSGILDEEAWIHPDAGGRLDREALERAITGLGKVRGIAVMGGFRPGVPVIEDKAACIEIALLDGGVRQVSDLSDVRRLVEVPVQRVRPSGDVVAGSFQGVFKVPKSIVQEAR